MPSRGRKRATESADERVLSVYDGADRLGMVVQRNGCVDAFDVNRVHLGTFKKIKAAADAVSSSLLRSCVGDPSARMDNSE
jgi:hypothetical protein